MSWIKTIFINIFVLFSLLGLLLMIPPMANFAFKSIQKYVKSKYLKSATLIYKEDPNDNYLIVCKNQTCSNKIKNLEELKSIEKNYVI